MLYLVWFYFNNLKWIILVWLLSWSIIEPNLSINTSSSSSSRDITVCVKTDPNQKIKLSRLNEPIFILFDVAVLKIDNILFDFEAFQKNRKITKLDWQIIYVYFIIIDPNILFLLINILNMFLSKFIYNLKMLH